MTKKIEHPGKYFNQLRKKEGLSVAELARLLDHCYLTVWQFLNCKQGLPPLLAFKLAVIFGKKTDTIYETFDEYMIMQADYSLSKVKNKDNMAQLIRDRYFKKYG